MECIYKTKLTWDDRWQKDAETNVQFCFILIQNFIFICVVIDYTFNKHTPIITRPIPLFIRSISTFYNIVKKLVGRGNFEGNRNER